MFSMEPLTDIPIIFIFKCHISMSDAQRLFDISFSRTISDVTTFYGCQIFVHKCSFAFQLF